jgi:dolichol kinase
MFVWVLFGDLISKIIQSDKANHVLGYILFALMIISIIMIWME